MNDASNVSKKPHFRNLRVRPYEPKQFLPGMREDGELVDVSSFTPLQYVVTFEYRTGWRQKWRKVTGYA